MMMTMMLINRTNSPTHQPALPPELTSIAHTIIRPISANCVFSQKRYGSQSFMRNKYSITAYTPPHPLLLGCCCCYVLPWSLPLQLHNTLATQLTSFLSARLRMGARRRTSIESVFSQIVGGSVLFIIAFSASCNSMVGDEGKEQQCG